MYAGMWTLEEGRDLTDGKILHCKTTDGGETWKKITKGLPKSNIHPDTYCSK